ncbi:MAG: Gx transporter family protein [Clostridia bacterium]|nr:Gx transporter family protein [Clostridia bacterium]
MTKKTKNLTILSMCTALAMILSFVESFVPVPLPGIKLGLANTVTLFLLYTLGPISAAGVAIVRIFLSTLLFGAFPTALIYSLSGFVLSFLVMLLAKWVLPFGKVGVSVLGAVFHNLGQVIAACFVMGTPSLAVYFIPLLVSGTVAGVIVGILSGIVISKSEKIIKK